MALFVLRGGFFGSASMNAHLYPRRLTCLLHLIFVPFRLQSPPCHFPIVALIRYFTAIGCRVDPPGRLFGRREIAVTRSRVRHWLAGSPTGLAESSSLSYGLVFHLQLLPTPPRGDAVTIGYRFVTLTWWGLTPH